MLAIMHLICHHILVSMEHHEWDSIYGPPHSEAWFSLIWARINVMISGYSQQEPNVINIFEPICPKFQGQCATTELYPLFSQNCRVMGKVSFFFLKWNWVIWLVRDCSDPSREGYMQLSCTIKIIVLSHTHNPTNLVLISVSWLIWCISCYPSTTHLVLQQDVSYHADFLVELIWPLVE